MRDSIKIGDKLNHKYFWGFAGLLLVLMLFLAPGAAINIDELIHYKQGEKVVDWYYSKGENTACLNTPTSHLKYYGQSVDNLSALINRVFSIEDEYLIRHFIGALVGLLLLLVIGLITIELTGSHLAGIIAMGLAFISPRLMGHVYGNLKDIPFALGYAWSILFILKAFKEMPNPRWATIFFLAFGIAFTNSVRIGGLVLFMYAGLAFVTWFLINNSEGRKWLADTAFWKKIIPKAIVLVTVGYFFSLAFWPYGLINPIKNPLEALSVMEHYKISIKQIFEGDVYWSTNLPWYYLPKWLLISIPEIVWIGVISMVVYLALNKNESNTYYFNIGFLAFAFLFPVVYVVSIKSNLYSGWRQMYFIYAPFVALSAAGVWYLLTKLKKAKLIGVVAGLAILAVLPVSHTIKTFPSDYIYFNSLASFNKKAWSGYEYDYYWHEMKKAATWLDQELGEERKGRKIAIAANFNVGPYLFDREDIEVNYVHFYDKISKEWDYALLGVNYIHPYQLKNKTWKPTNVVKEFYHLGNPSVVIVKRQDTCAVNGYKAYKSRDFENAKKRLSKAVNNDPNDLNIMVYLAESLLALGELEKMDRVISESEKIHPEYEPIKLLKAKKQIQLKEYKQALAELNNLVRINPRYFKVIPYLIKCYEATGELEKANQLRIKYNV